MAVRFLPPPEERPKLQREEQGDLAEVIEFRSRLRRPEPEIESEPESEFESGSEPGARPGQVPATRGEAPGGAWPRLVEAPFGRGRAAAARTAGPAGAAGSVSAAGGSPVAAAGDPAAAGPDGFGGGTADALDDGPTAYETSVKLLARRALSSGELHRALVAAGHPELDAEEAVAKCVESLYLDDDDVARSVATKLRESKGESKARIRQKLRERHLPDAAIDAALEGLDDDAEHELLRQTAIDRARRMDGLDRQTAERRLLGFLARRGWSGERASRAAREALDGAARGGGRGSVRFQ